MSIGDGDLNSKKKIHVVNMRNCVCVDACILVDDFMIEMKKEDDFMADGLSIFDSIYTQ